MVENLTKASGPLLEQAISYGTRLLGVLVLIIAAVILAGFVRKRLLRIFERSEFDPTLSKFFSNMARWAILAFAFVSVLGVFGVQTTSLAAVLGAAGLAVGLAFQGTLSNFSAGVMLLVFRPFKVGQFVRVAGEAGTVVEIDLFTTHLDTPDNRRIILPNGAIFGATIENISHHATRRVDVAVGTAYGADLDETRRTLESAAKKVSGVLTDPAPQVVLNELGASSVDWVVRVWCATDDYWPTKDALTRDVKLALDSADIEIPFPQLDVHTPQLLATQNTELGSVKKETGQPATH